MVKSLSPDKKHFFNLLAKLAMKVSNLSVDEIAYLKNGYAKFSKEEIHKFSKTTKILPFVAHLFISLNIDALFWKSVFEYYEKRNLKIIGVLNRIFRKFSNSKINKIFVYENFGALLSSKTPIGCFASGDVDLFADGTYKNKINDILISEKFYPQKTDVSSETVKTEYFNKELFDTGFGINIMWKPLSRLKLPFQLNINNFIQWDKLEKYKGTSILYPTKDALMYLCLLHISIHGYHRSPDIRLYTDTARVSLLEPDWNNIASFAKQDKTEVRTVTAAILSNKLLEMPIPQDWISKYSKKFRQISKLLKSVYDSKNNYLKKEPQGLSVLLIEILSSDSHWFITILRIIFPSKDWISEYYLQGRGSLLKGYIMHFRNLI